MVWYFPDRKRQVDFLKHCKMFQTSTDLDAIRGCSYCVIDDAEGVDPNVLCTLVDWPLYTAMAFLPSTNIPENKNQMTLLKKYSKHQNAQWMGTFLTEADQAELKEKLSAEAYKRDIEGKFWDDV